MPSDESVESIDRELPNVPGKSMRAVLVEYGPGGAPQVCFGARGDIERAHEHVRFQPLSGRLC